MITDLSQVTLMRSRDSNGETQSYWDMKDDFTIIIHDRDIFGWKEIVLKHFGIVLNRQAILLEERKKILKRAWKNLCKYGWQKEKWSTPSIQAA